jgi:hypothetical protein
MLQALHFGTNKKNGQKPIPIAKALVEALNSQYF